MPEKRPRLTAALGQQICAYIRAGGYPAVAAEAAGVPAKLFRGWLARGRRKQAREPYRSFAAAVREAAAQARVKAEIAALKKDAIGWLKCGPGRETGAARGWSQPVRAKVRARRGQSALLLPEVARMLEQLLGALAPFPEARAAAAAALAETEPQGH